MEENDAILRKIIVSKDDEKLEQRGEAEICRN